MQDRNPCYSGRNVQQFVAGNHKVSRLRNLLKQAVADAIPNILIAVAAVAAVAADPAARGVSFSLCKPLEGEDANELYRNPRLFAERYDEEFKKPFCDMIDRMLRSGGALRSPFMESLQAGLAETPGFLNAAWLRRVVIASDLLQHSDSFSFYRGDDWRSFEGSTAFGRMAKTLDGVDSAGDAAVPVPKTGASAPCLASASASPRSESACYAAQTGASPRPAP